MAGLVFKKIWILSKTEKKARKINLKKGVNILTGENDVGKSTLIKSLYHTLGADVPQMDNTRWKQAKAIYCIHINLSGNEFYIMRDGKYFGVFGKNKNLISQHQGITTEGGIAHFICNKLNFKIELERASNSQLGRAGQAYYFLPFYIDQDEGWFRSWSSFKGLQQFRNYRKLMIDYHLGVRSQKFYDAKKKEIKLKDNLKELDKEINALRKVHKNYEKRKKLQQVDLDPSAFRDEIEKIIDEFNIVYSQQQEILHKLKEIRGERNGIDADLNILRHAISELNMDYSYAESPEIEDNIDCPTCGTSFENSFVDRFGILDDIDYCQGLVDQKKKNRMDVQILLKKTEELYKESSKKLESVEEILKRKKENITFSELIKSEGIKEILSSIIEDMSILQNKIDNTQIEVDDLKDDLKLDQSHKKNIVNFYQSRMKEYLNDLNVHVLEEDDYKTLDKVIKNNALGSDLPRALLAQYFSLLQTMKKFNDTITCPMIIDSPQQQEQDPTNLDAIFNFIFNKLLPGQQLILGTISLENLSEKIIPENVNYISLGGKLSLLRTDQYEQVLSEISGMHDKTLSS